MGIYYYKLWDMLESRNITQRELIENLHLSTATLTKMRKNQTVSMETIDLIREYLGCDYGDYCRADGGRRGVQLARGRRCNENQRGLPYCFDRVYGNAVTHPADGCGHNNTISKHRKKFYQRQNSLLSFPCEADAAWQRI